MVCQVFAYVSVARTSVLDDYNRVSRYSCCLPTFLLLRAQVCGVSKDAYWPEQVLLLGVVLRAQGLFYADRNSFGELVVTIIPCIMMIVPSSPLHHSQARVSATTS